MRLSIFCEKKSRQWTVGRVAHEVGRRSDASLTTVIMTSSGDVPSRTSAEPLVAQITSNKVTSYKRLPQLVVTTVTMGVHITTTPIAAKIKEASL